MEPKAFLIDKPEGMGSTDVVRHFKRNLPKPFKKIGHFGTLDPFATGLLIVGINGAQRLADYIHAKYPKTYKAIGVIGIESDTGDRTGLLKKEVVPEITADSIEMEKKWNAMFSKDYFQKPPAYSAAKFKGKNLYEYAREGIHIEKEPVPRSIIDLKIIRWELPEIEFEVTVTSGTYIRVLFEDMAKSLGTVGHLKELRRTAIGIHKVDESKKPDSWPPVSISVEKLYPAKEEVLSSEELFKKYVNGVVIATKDVTQQLSEGEHCWIKSPMGRVLGLAKCVDGELKVEFNFPQSN